MPFSDKEIRAAYLREYAKQNEGHLREYRRQWYIDNKDRIRERDSTPEKRARKKQLNFEWLDNNREKRIWSAAKNSAKSRGLNFDIEVEDIIIPDECPIFSIPLFFSPDHKTDNTPSIDRRDSSEGYVKGNIWIISWKANRLKNNADLRDLIELGDWARSEVSRSRGK